MKQESQPNPSKKPTPPTTHKRIKEFSLLPAELRRRFQLGYRKLRLTVGATDYLLLISIAVYSIVFSSYESAKYEFFRTGFFDLGQVVQQTWMVSHGYVTGWALGRPLFLLLGGLFAIYPHAETLQLFVSFMTALGALPLYLLARKELNNQLYALIISILYLTSPALWGVLQYEFHDMAIGITFMMFCAYFYRLQKIKSYLASLVLALFSNEAFVILGGFMALSFLVDYYSVRTRQNLVFTALTACAVTLFGIYLEATPYIPQYYLSTVPSGAYTLSGSAVFLNPSIVLADPIRAISESLPDKLQYMMALFAPVLFLPLLAIRRLLPAFPWFAVIIVYTSAFARVGGTGPVFLIWSQWSSFVIPFIFISTIYGFKRLTVGTFGIKADAAKCKQLLILMVIVTVALSVATGAFSPFSRSVVLAVGDNSVPTDVNPALPYHGVWPTPVANYGILDSFIGQIPKSYSVLTQNQIGSKLWDRPAPIWIFYQPGYNYTSDPKADAILIDYQLAGLCTGCLNNLLSTGNYVLMNSYTQGGIYLYFRT